MKKQNIVPDTDKLLQNAEEQLNSEKDLKSFALTNDGIKKLVHELQVHQIELEMLNEQLREAEEQARKNAEKYTILYDFFPSAYFTLSREGQIEELNLLGAQLLGKERSNLVKQMFGYLLTPATRVKFNDFLKSIFELKTRQTCEARLIKEGGPSAIIHLEGVVSEEIEKCLITAHDITAYKTGTEQLQESETRYKRLFESAKDGILMLDAVNGEIIDVNPYLTQLLEYSSEELMGKQLWEIEAFKNVGYSKLSFTELQIKQFMRYEDMPLITKSGKSIYVEFVSSVYVADHEKIIQCHMRDVTEYKQLEKALKESEKRLLELNATKDKFFSIIAHDIRGPFNSIMGFSELLIQQVQEKNYAEVENYASIIHQSSQRAMELVTNLLEWSRSKLGRMKFTLEKVDISALINSVAQLLKDTAQQKGINIQIDAPENVIIYADQVMINAILRNLVSNAVKFTHHGGEIVISLQQQQSQIVVMVADNGIGMKKEVLNKLFSMDESYSTPGTQDEKGSGLGLILCKEFIEKHGGEIRVESEPGKGSKFYFSIPKNIKKPARVSSQFFNQ